LIKNSSSQDIILLLSDRLSIYSLKPWINFTLTMIKLPQYLWDLSLSLRCIGRLKSSWMSRHVDRWRSPTFRKIILPSFEGSINPMCSLIFIILGFFKLSVAIHHHQLQSILEYTM
jgi:hypothetical protein